MENLQFMWIILNTKMKKKDASINAINKIFFSIKNSKIPLRVFYHTSKGIEIDRLTPEITKTNHK